MGAAEVSAVRLAPGAPQASEVKAETAVSVEAVAFHRTNAATASARQSRPVTMATVAAGTAVRAIA